MLKISSIFTENAVIDARYPHVFGTAAPQSKIEVQLADQKQLVSADKNGKWRVSFTAMIPGGPHTLVVKGDGAEIQSKNILLGEVWIGSGQSNMEWTLGAFPYFEKEIASARESMHRMFVVEKAVDLEKPLDDVVGKWIVLDSKITENASAVAYFFGKRLVQDLQVPVGTIVSAWGGSPIAAWLPEAVLGKRPEYQEFIDQLDVARGKKGDYDTNRPHADPGISQIASTWHEKNIDDTKWEWLQVPGTWQSQGWNFNGAVWYTKVVKIPTDWIGKDLHLELGPVDDFDQTWVNGVKVGSVGMETQVWWDFHRSYPIAASSVTCEEVRITVRVFDQWGNGGAMGSPELRLASDDKNTISLKGMWKAKVELELPVRAPKQPWPSTLWNGMLAPLIGLGCKGVIWYQGESDAVRAKVYQRLLDDMIRVWRQELGLPHLYFGIVQLANFKPRKEIPGEDDWAELRDAQLKVARTIPGVGLAVAIDAGEETDIHPRYKDLVGDRLAADALHHFYSKNHVIPSGPVAVEHWREKSAICIRFDYAQGLRFKEGKARGFQIAGKDRRWIWADAEIKDDVLRVFSTEINEPTAVRYAWQANPEISLENDQALPASPFRTDDWVELGWS